MCPYLINRSKAEIFFSNNIAALNVRIWTCVLKSPDPDSTRKSYSRSAENEGEMYPVIIGYFNLYCCEHSPLVARSYVDVLNSY
jgi:hypothetical protein